MVVESTAGLRDPHLQSTCRGCWSLEVHMASYPEIARSTSLELFVVACSESFLHRLGPPLSRRASRSCLQLRSELPRRRCNVCSHRVCRIYPPGPIRDEIVSKPGVALVAATSSQALLRRSELDGTACLHRSAYDPCRLFKKDRARTWSILQSA